MKSATRLFAALLLSAAVLPAAQAVDKPGMAIVAGAEVGFGKCLAVTEKEGYSCARKRCQAAGKGDPATQCEQVKWCDMAGFGGVVTINNSEGFTSAEYLCDEPTQAALTAKARSLCTSAYGESANGCAFTMAWDPKGKDLTIEDDMSAPPQP